MKAAGNLVAAAAEFAAGMKHRQHHRHGGDSQLFIDAHRDAPAVVPHGYHIAGKNLHLDMGAEARQRFIDGVVHNFIYQMIQALGTGGADIHARPLAHRLQAFQHLDLTFVIGLVLRPYHAVFQLLLLQFFFCTHWM